MSRARTLALGAAAMLFASVSPAVSAAAAPSGASRLALVGAQSASSVCSTRAGMEGLYRQVGGRDYRCTNREAEWRDAGVNTPCVARPGEDGAWREVVTRNGLEWGRCGGVGGWAWLAGAGAIGGIIAAVASGGNSNPPKSP